MTDKEYMQYLKGKDGLLHVRLLEHQPGEIYITSISDAEPVMLENPDTRTKFAVFRAKEVTEEEAAKTTREIHLYINEEDGRNHLFHVVHVSKKIEVDVQWMAGKASIMMKDDECATMLDNIAKIKDHEIRHSDADEVLYNLLKELGFSKTVEAFHRVEKYYA